MALKLFQTGNPAYHHVHELYAILESMIRQIPLLEYQVIEEIWLDYETNVGPKYIFSVNVKICCLINQVILTRVRSWDLE